MRAEDAIPNSTIQCRQIVGRTQKPYPGLNTQFGNQRLRSFLPSMATAACKIDGNGVAVLDHLMHGPYQSGVIFLTRKPCGHDHGILSVLPRQTLSPTAKVDAVVDSDTALRRVAESNQRFTNGIRDGNQCIGTPCQPQRLLAPPPAVPLTHIVFDMDQMGNPCQQTSISSPEVITEAMRNQDVWLPHQAQLPQSPNSQKMRTTGHQFNAQPLGTQLRDPCRRIVGASS